MQRREGRKKKGNGKESIEENEWIACRGGGREGEGIWKGYHIT